MRRTPAKLFSLLYSADEVEGRNPAIYEAMFEPVATDRSANFTLIGTDDLQRLFGVVRQRLLSRQIGRDASRGSAHPMISVCRGGWSVRPARLSERVGP